MFKILKHILPAILALVFVTACDKRLDVAPTQSVDENNALLTAQDVQATLTGAYDGLGNGAVLGGGIQYTTELLGDDREVVFAGTFSTLDEIWRKTITPGNTDVRDTWLNSYNAINRANNVLASLNLVADEDRNKVEGEARFIRGILYFSLVKL